MTTLSVEEGADLRLLAVRVLQRAGPRALAHFRAPLAIDDKDPGAGFDPVTAADREAESAIRAALAEARPHEPVLGEEGGGSATRTGRGWTVDPVDGTRGFVSGFVQWGMLLAHTVDGAPVVGAMHQPFTGETFSGGPDGAWYERGGAPARSISVRPCAEPATALLATTDPYLFEGVEAAAFERVRRAVRQVRYGGDCYAYCLLAAGHLDGVVESGLSPWDVQALVPIVRAAGGRITDWNGGDCAQGGRVLATGDARLHAHLSELLGAVPGADEEGER